MSIYPFGTSGNEAGQYQARLNKMVSRKFFTLYKDPLSTKSCTFCLTGNCDLTNIMSTVFPDIDLNPNGLFFLGFGYSGHHTTNCFYIVSAQWRQQLTSDCNS